MIDLNDIVIGYVIRQVRRLTGGHDQLFERGLRLYQLLEGEVMADTGAARGRVDKLLHHPLARTAVKLLPGRVRSIIDRGVLAMDDNRKVMAALSARIGKASGTSAATVEREYCSVLREQVPCQRSLDNVIAIADACALLHELLTSRGLRARAMRTQGYSLVRSLVLRDDTVRAEADALWTELNREPQELLVLADSVRAHGPTVVSDIYDATGSAK